MEKKRHVEISGEIGRDTEKQRYGNRERQRDGDREGVLPHLPTPCDEGEPATVPAVVAELDCFIPSASHLTGLSQNTL